VALVQDPKGERVSNPGEDVATRARCLALAQGSNEQVAAGLVVEFGLSMDAARRFVSELSEELQVMRFAGQMGAKERLHRLMNGEDLGKLTGAHLAAMETYGRAYLGLGEREATAKAIEQAYRDLAKKHGAPKRGPTGVAA
jgi:polyhydroxyalkanoate synthesis regulator phasin